MRPQNEIKFWRSQSTGLRSKRTGSDGFFAVFLALVSSLIFHGLLIVAVRQLPARQILKARSLPSPIEMLEVPLAKRHSVKVAKAGLASVAHGRRSIRSSTMKEIALNQLIVKNGDLAARPQSVDEKNKGTGESNQPSDDSSTAAWGSGAFDFKRVEDYSFMHRIFERTNDALFYPSVLAAHQISGTVTSRLVFTGKGDCDWDQTTIQSSQPHLRIYILSVLKGVCWQNYSQFLRGRRNIVVDLFFEFSITEHDDKQIANDRQKIMGNVLAFFRNSQHSVGEWHLGPFKGMFPVPMVAVDFGWLTENWEKVMNNKDALREADKDFAD